MVTPDRRRRSIRLLRGLQHISKSALMFGRLLSTRSDPVLTIVRLVVGIIFFAPSSALENGSHGVVVDERIRENLRFKRRLQLIKHRLLGRIGRVYAISLDEAGLVVVGRKFRRTGQCFVEAEALTTTAESLISALLINWPPVHDSTVTRVLLTLKPGLVRKSARVPSPAHFSVEH